MSAESTHSTTRHPLEQHQQQRRTRFHVPSSRRERSSSASSPHCDSHDCPSRSPSWDRAPHPSQTRTWTSSPLVLRSSIFPSNHCQPFYDSRPPLPPSPPHTHHLHHTMVPLVLRLCSWSHMLLRLQATSVFRFDPRSKVWSSSPRRVRCSSLGQWRTHASAFLNCWTCGTSSLQDGQIAEWVPILTFAVGVHMELLDWTTETPSCRIISAPVPTNIPPGLPRSSRPSLCVASFPSMPRYRPHPRTQGTWLSQTTGQPDNVDHHAVGDAVEVATHLAHVAGYDVGVLRALNVCWGSEFGEASHLGRLLVIRGEASDSRESGKPISPKRSHSHHHTTLTLHAVLEPRWAFCSLLESLVSHRLSLCSFVLCLAARLTMGKMPNSGPQDKASKTTWRSTQLEGPVLHQ